MFQGGLNTFTAATTDIKIWKIFSHASWTIRNAVTLFCAFSPASNRPFHFQVWLGRGRLAVSCYCDSMSHPRTLPFSTSGCYNVEGDSLILPILPSVRIDGVNLHPRTSQLSKGRRVSSALVGRPIRLAVEISDAQLKTVEEIHILPRLIESSGLKSYPPTARRCIHEQGLCCHDNTCSRSGWSSIWHSLKHSCPSLSLSISEGRNRRAIQRLLSASSSTWIHFLIQRYSTTLPSIILSPKPICVSQRAQVVNF